MVAVKLDLDLGLARGNVRPRYGREAVAYGELASDADFLYAAVRGGEVAYAASNMTRVSYRGRSLFEALPNTFPLQLDGAAPRTAYARWRFWSDVVKVKD